MAPGRGTSMAAALGAAVGTILTITGSIVVLGDRLWARTDDMASLKSTVDQVRDDVREIKRQIGAPRATQERAGRRP